MPITFQPEEVGYYVASITVGMFYALYILKRYVCCDIDLIPIQMVILSTSCLIIPPVMN